MACEAIEIVDHVFIGIAGLMFMHGVYKFIMEQL